MHICRFYPPWGEFRCQKRFTIFMYVIYVYFHKTNKLHPFDILKSTSGGHEAEALALKVVQMVLDGDFGTEIYRQLFPAWKQMEKVPKFYNTTFFLTKGWTTILTQDYFFGLLVKAEHFEHTPPMIFLQRIEVSFSNLQVRKILWLGWLRLGHWNLFAPRHVSSGINRTFEVLFTSVCTRCAKRKPRPVDVWFNYFPSHDRPDFILCILYD